MLLHILGALSHPNNVSVRLQVVNLGSVDRERYRGLCVDNKFLDCHMTVNHAFIQPNTVPGLYIGSNLDNNLISKPFDMSNQVIEL